MASICSSTGCQSVVYFTSNRLTVMFNGAPNCAVDEITQFDPDRASRTCSMPTRVPDRNTVNSTSPSPGAAAVGCGAGACGCATALDGPG